MRTHRFYLAGFALFLITILAMPFAPSLHAEHSSKADPVKRGEYLVNIGGCHDCHTPKIFTEKGPQPDMSRALSGHPADEKIPPVPQGVIGPNQWGGLMTNGLTAWTGPWGVSFTMNLTPDQETGLGSWTEEMFMKALRTGKHMGEGRDILPPMPWQFYRLMTDEDLKAVFAYLRTIKPIRNPVPDPIPPAHSH